MTGFGRESLRYWSGHWVLVRILRRWGIGEASKSWLGYWHAGVTTEALNHWL